jgi:hypothetical protein
MSVYGRLNYKPGVAVFNGVDQLSSNTITYLSQSAVSLTPSQIDDIQNSTANSTSYYKNPHANTLASIALYLNSMTSQANTANIVFTNAPDRAVVLSTALASIASSLFSFTVHTNNISGVRNSEDASLYPDLNSSQALGRQILNITSSTDSIQNNSPMIGSITSLFIGANLSSLSTAITNDYLTLNNSLITATNPYTNSISNASMNVIITDVTTLQSVMNTQRTSDYTFYQNSLAVLKDYQNATKINNIGSTQKSIINLIGTDKLKTNLGY